MTVFLKAQGYRLALYLFPQFTQALLERHGPSHCHQLVLVVRKQRHLNDESRTLSLVADRPREQWR